MAHLKSSYPSKFQSCYPSEAVIHSAMNHWERQLSGIPEEIILRALDEMPKRYTWIPDVSEFYALCKSLMGSQKTPWIEEIREQTTRRHPNLAFEQEINLSAEIVNRICKIFPEVKQDKEKNLIWNNRAAKFTTEIKKAAKKFFPDLSEIERLKKVREFSDEDYRDILEGNKNG